MLVALAAEFRPFECRCARHASVGGLFDARAQGLPGLGRTETLVLPHVTGGADQTLRIQAFHKVLVFDNRTGSREQIGLLLDQRRVT